MSVQVCDGHTDTGEACDGGCDPHRAEMERRIKQQRAVYDIAYRLRQEGREEDSDLLYALGQGIWDDAIHIASPANGHVSLCGERGRNLAPLNERPDGWAGCWTCLHEADRLAGAGADGGQDV